MSSNNMILIAPSSQRTQDFDVSKLLVIIEKVVKVASKKLLADFEIRLMRDMPNIEDVACQPAQGCEHVFSIRNQVDDEIINTYTDIIPGTVIIKCLKCGIEYDFCKNTFEIDNIVNKESIKVLKEDKNV